MKKTMLFAALALTAGSVCAAETIEIKAYKDWAKGSYVKPQADGVWEIPGSRDLSNAKSVKVDPAKKYTLSFEVRKTPETQKVFFYAGFWPLNEDMVRIAPHNARCERNSETVLTADAAAGSKSIRITEPKRWRKGARSWCVSLNDKKNCSGVDMSVICNAGCGEQAADGSMEVMLKSPLTKDYKAGTAVHFHSEGPGMYSACKEKDPSTEWEKVSVTVSGIQTTAGTPKNDQWWAGTKYAKIRFLVSTSDRKAKVQLRNIKLIVE